VIRPGTGGNCVGSQKRQVVPLSDDGRSKPVPLEREEERPYWDGLREGRLLLRQCQTCGWYAQRPQLVCWNCRGESFIWSAVSGRGSIYTYTVARQTWVRGFEDDLPYVVVAVALEEQPSLLVTTNLVGDVDVDRLNLGLPVIATFESRGEVTLLQFRLVHPVHV
jgi:uncharacterized OB-fold protein